MADKIEPVGGSADSTQGQTGRGRFQKLAEALRANLRKRKEQERARRDQADRPSGEDDPNLVPSPPHITDFEA